MGSIKRTSSGIILAVILGVAIMNGIMMGNWNASINPTQPGRFIVGALFGALYVLAPSLLVFFILYRSKSIEVTSFRLALWLPTVIWVIVFFDGMENITGYILTTIYFSYGLFPIVYYPALELVRRRTNIKSRVRFGECIVSMTMFAFINISIYLLAYVLPGLASQGAGQ